MIIATKIEHVGDVKIITWATKERVRASNLRLLYNKNPKMIARGIAKHALNNYRNGQNKKEFKPKKIIKIGKTVRFSADI